MKNIAQAYMKEMAVILENFSMEALEEVAIKIRQAYDKGKHIFVMGNGGSGTTASHFACDINKGVSKDLEKRFKMICLNDSIPTMLAYANDIAYEDIFIEQLKNFLEPEDVVIGISASGNSKNVIKAIQYAKENSGITIGLTGFDGGQLSRISATSVIVPSNDMQKIEDTHLILLHIIMRIFYSQLVVSS